MKPQLRLPFDLYDAMALIGLGMVCWGLYQVWPPAAWMAGGIVLLALGAAGAARKGKGG